MSNYNERLDEILDGILWTGHKWAIDRLDRTPNVVLAEAKQAITSLIKELVAEAKPEVPIIADYFALDSYRNAINQFEQNLLKALEEHETKKSNPTQS